MEMTGSTARGFVSREPSILLPAYWDSHLGPVSRKSRNLTGHFWVSEFPLYLKNGEDLSRQTSQSFFFSLP